MKLRHVLCGSLAPTLLAWTAQAQAPLTVIHAEPPTSPKSDVPFALDLAGNPATTRFKALEDYIVSPDGSLWILRGRTEQGTDLENILLIGSGTAVTGNFAQEGQPIPGGATGELFDFFGSAMGRFNGANQFAYSARARGGVSGVAQKVIRWDGVSSSIVFQQGDLYTNLQDIPANPSGDETVGNSIGSIHLLDDGRIGSQDSTIGGISSLRRPAITYDLDAFHQTNVTSVAGMGGVGTFTVKTLTANSFYTSLDGNHWISRGQIVTGGTTDDDVVFVDDEVVLQESVAVPGSSLILGSTFDSGMSPGGNWFARGRDSSGTTAAAPDWAVLNGTLIAETGQAIPNSPGENYGDTFYSFTANDAGDWALAANTDGLDPATNDAIVVNGHVIAREGDPVDLDDNGLFDDDAFIGRGNNTLSFIKANSLMLTETGLLYAIVNLRDGAGNDLNSVPSFGTPDAFVVFDVSAYVTAGTGSAFCTGGGAAACPCGNQNDGSNGAAGCANSAGAGGGKLVALGSRSIAAGDLVFVGSTLQPGQSGLYLQGNNAVNGGAGNPFGDGLRCAGGNVFRLEVRNSGMTGASFTTVNIAAAGGVSAGDTRRYQLWFRDTAGPCGGGFNFTNGWEITWLP